MWKHAGKRAYGTCDLMHATDLEIPSAYYANDEWIEITGSGGVLFIHRATGTIHEGPVVSLFDGRTWEQHDIASDWSLGFSHATENFIDAIEGKAPPLLSGKAAREILRFSLALQKSARLRREVFVEEMDRAVPGLYAWQRRRAERSGGHRDGEGILAKLGIGVSFDRFAPMARSLTEERARGVDPSAAAGVETIVALHLTPQGGVEERLGVYVKGGAVTLRAGELPADAKLTLRIPSGVWAAILMKKTRIETALFRGHIRLEGRAEEAIKLRALFRI
jgi:putative sterol carrier protein